MILLEYLADSAFSYWLSVSMLGFPTLIALHSVGMAIAVGLALMVTLHFYRFYTGLDTAQISRFLNVAIWGFVLNLVTGLLLFITRGPEYLQSLMFLSKMVLVAIGTTGLLLLRRRLKQARTTDGNLEGDAITRRLSLVASFAFFGAVVAGRLIAYLSELYR